MNFLPEENAGDETRSNDRRKFLKISGAAVAAIGIGAATRGMASPLNFFDTPMGMNNMSVVDLGSGDTGILNYAYALEQLEAAFYTQAVSNPYKGMTPEETQILTDIRDHEIVHREFFKAALGANAIPGLTPNFGKINFNDRAAVLATAQTFEDLGVAAYNGAGQLLKNPDYLLVAGKIVSVEARHASVIRDLIRPRTRNFSVGALDKAKKPLEVLAAAGPFIANKISANNLPKT